MEEMIEQQLPALREKVQARLTKPSADVTDEELTGILTIPGTVYISVNEALYRGSPGAYK